MARFHVRDTFTVEDKSTFVMAGFVIEGEITEGMSVRMPFKENVMITSEIDHTQVIRRPDGDVVCLCIRCGTPKEAALWKALKIKDQTIEIISTPS